MQAPCRRHIHNAQRGEQGRSLTNAAQSSQGIAARGRAAPAESNRVNRVLVDSSANEGYGISGSAAFNWSAPLGPSYLGASELGEGGIVGCLVSSVPATMAFRIWLKMSVRVFGVCGIRIVFVWSFAATSFSVSKY